MPLALDAFPGIILQSSPSNSSTRPQPLSWYMVLTSKPRNTVFREKRFVNFELCQCKAFLVTITCYACLQLAQKTMPVDEKTQKPKRVKSKNPKERREFSPDAWHVITIGITHLASQSTTHACHHNRQHTHVITIDNTRMSSQSASHS